MTASAPPCVGRLHGVLAVLPSAQICSVAHARLDQSFPKSALGGTEARERGAQLRLWPGLLLHQLGESFRNERSAEQEALRVIAPVGVEKRKLAVIFHALGD